MGVLCGHGIGNSTAGHAVGGAGQQFPPRIVGQDHSAVEEHRVVRILTPQFLFLVLAYHTKGVRFGKFFIRLGMFHKAAAAGAEAQAVQRDGVIAQQASVRPKSNTVGATRRAPARTCSPFSSIV